MRLLLNVIWLLFGGLWLALGYFAAGALCCLLVVTIPFGIASFRIGVYALWPFGKTVIAAPTAGIASLIGNVIWVVVAGWWLVIGHVLTACAMAITIIGLPLAVANLKMIPVSLTPLGKRIVDANRLGYAEAPVRFP